MKYDYIYDSEKQVYEAEVSINRETEPDLKVLFEKENIILHADRHGNATFYDVAGNEIHKGKAESEISFNKIYVCIKEEKISVRFPIIEWIDHYPNCDGEYDRWSERIVDNIYIYCPIK